MQLYKRGSVWWTRIDGKRVSTRCRDRKAAELAARALERRRADPRHAAAQTTTLGDAVRSLTAELRRRGRTAATHLPMRSEVRPLGKPGSESDSAEVFASEVESTVSNLYRHFALAKCQWDQLDRWAYEVERG